MMKTYPAFPRNFLHRLLPVFILALVAISLVLPGKAASGQSQQAIVLTYSGALTPSMLQYLSRGLSQAEATGSGLVILQLNTPGGEIELMNKMVTLIRESRIPVVVYIAPRGAMAGSAGTVITLAGHAAAMAPETAIGAASPVGSQGEDIGGTMEAKTKQILKATVRSLAEQRSPAAIALAEETIETARAVSSSEALEIGLIDFIAADVPDLLNQLDGFEVTTSAGKVTLATRGMVLQPLESSLIEQLLQLLTNPNIVFLLLSVGIQAILIELSSPGGWFAGFIGAVCLALAVYGLGILPVNWFGLFFILAAFVLFIVDIKAPTHGALTAAGIGSFIAGALILFNSPSIPSFQHVSVPLVVVTGLLTAAIFFTVVSFAVRAQKKPVLTGRESLQSRVGIVKKKLDPVGSVLLNAELWTAESKTGEPVAAGTQVRVVETRGLRLVVSPVDEKTG